MIVAGLELTRMTRSPSWRSTRRAWGPEWSNSLAWPMMIGPEPMTRTLSMSSRRGIRRGPFCWAESSAAALHQVDERVEQRVGVVRTRRRLGVVLHREGRQVEQPQPLDDVV